MCFVLTGGRWTDPLGPRGAGRWADDGYTDIFNMIWLVNETSNWNVKNVYLYIYIYRNITYGWSLGWRRPLLTWWWPFWWWWPSARPWWHDLPLLLWWHYLLLLWWRHYLLLLWWWHYLLLLWWSHNTRRLRPSWWTCSWCRRRDAFWRQSLSRYCWSRNTTC